MGKGKESIQGHFSSRKYHNFLNFHSFFRLNTFYFSLFKNLKCFEGEPPDQPYLYIKTLKIFSIRKKFKHMKLVQRWQTVTSIISKKYLNRK